ncbi:alpha/beta fold hydrolase [Streptomyces sp. NPDC086838]|uniref:alpha/beta fold hydrolase n=1 Tax=Streptomyces sp. NPDC086838 TaxID=3365762 RepID=UPI0038277373
MACVTAPNALRWWRKVRKRRGVEVAVPGLHHGSLAADTAAVQAVTDALSEPPVVLSHSYGGSVITGIRSAAHLVYLSAFMPDAGESAASLGGRPNSSRTPLSLSRMARPPCTPVWLSTPCMTTALNPSPRGRSACCVRRPRAADEEPRSTTTGRRPPLGRPGCGSTEVESEPHFGRHLSTPRSRTPSESLAGVRGGG